ASESTGATSAGLLRIATAAYLARYKGTSRIHTASDLRIYLGWCADRDVDPLEAQRVDVELYVRWSQEVHGLRHLTQSNALVCRWADTADGAGQTTPSVVDRPPGAGGVDTPTLLGAAGSVRWLAMYEIARMAGFYAAHGVWSVSDGETLNPLLGYVHA